jgi:hypothetical protein
MPAAYSTDIRGRVIASVESGSSRREAAEEFDVRILTMRPDDVEQPARPSD